MSAKKEKEIMEFAQWFLTTLSERCLQECGKAVTSLQFPVFKKVLSYRVKRELQFYRLCLDAAAVLLEAGCCMSACELDEIMEDSIDLDNRLRRDVKFMPVTIHFDYPRILPLRKERIRKQVDLFMRLLAAGKEGDYYYMVKTALARDEFLEKKNEILELYVEEAYIINSSLSSPIKVDTGAIAERMYCSMLDIGIGMNKETADRIYSQKVSLWEGEG